MTHANPILASSYARIGDCTASVCDDLRNSLALAIGPGPNTWTEHDAETEQDDDAPLPYWVTLDGDIIGTGESVSEALADAVATARGWL